MPGTQSPIEFPQCRFPAESSTITETQPFRLVIGGLGLVGSFPAQGAPASRRSSRGDKGPCAVCISGRVPFVPGTGTIKGMVRRRQPGQPGHGLLHRIISSFLCRGPIQLMPEPIHCQRKQSAVNGYTLKWVAVLLLLASVVGFSTTAKDGLLYSVSKVTTRLLKSTKISESRCEESGDTLDLGWELRVHTRFSPESRQPLPEQVFVSPSLSAWLSVRQLRSPPVLS